jgi:Tol biopolymer transport system component
MNTPPARSNHRSIVLMILVVMLATAASGCAHLLDFLLFSPYITTNKLPNGTVGVAYSAKLDASHDLGAGWYITGGQLPPGLHFDDSRISGTPTVGGTFKFEVTVVTSTSNVPNQDSRRFTLLILDVSTQTLPDGTANQVYGPFILGAVGLVGTPSWAIDSGNLPSGIILTSSGVLTGTPASGGTFPFTVKVTDQDVPPRSKTRDLSLVILNPVPMPALLSPNSTAGSGPSFNLLVSGSNFVTTSVVTWNAADRPTTYVNATHLMAAIPASDISTGGTVSVAVRNPAPQGGVSKSFAFDVAPAANSSLVSERVSVDTQGNQANGPSARPSVSTNGRFIAFESLASNLTPGDSNRVSDIFLRDTCRKAGPGCIPSTVRVSLANDGSEPNGASLGPSISADGRYVVFTSLADNLVGKDRNSGADIFLRDTCIGATGECRPSTALVSVDNTGVQANSGSDFGKISGSGRFVAFVSAADNLVVEDTNLSEDIFVHDTCAGAAEPCFPSTSRASVGPNGLQADGASTMATLSHDGRYVAFVSHASNIVPGVKADVSKVFRRDTCAGTAELCTPSTIGVSVTDEGVPGDGPSLHPAISPDGRFVAFLSTSSNLGATGGTLVRQIFLRDTCRGTTNSCRPSTMHISAAADDSAGDAEGSAPAISAEGRYVAFVSAASHLVPDDANQCVDAFVHDTCLGLASTACIKATWRLSRGRLGDEADADTLALALTPDGRVLAFTSTASNLVPGDSNGAEDVFVISAREDGPVS